MLKGKVIRSYDELTQELESARAECERLRKALGKIATLEAHSSGCGKMFEWPFRPTLKNGCNCGTNIRPHIQIAIEALRGEEGK
jgi:hypothetical protein